MPDHAMVTNKTTYIIIAKNKGILFTFFIATCNNLIVPPNTTNSITESFSPSSNSLISQSYHSLIFFNFPCISPDMALHIIISLSYIKLFVTFVIIIIIIIIIIPCVEMGESFHYLGYHFDFNMSSS